MAAFVWIGGSCKTGKRETGQRGATEKGQRVVAREVRKFGRHLGNTLALHRLRDLPQPICRLAQHVALQGRILQFSRCGGKSFGCPLDLVSSPALCGFRPALDLAACFADRGPCFVLHVLQALAGCRRGLPSRLLEVVLPRIRSGRRGNGLVFIARHDVLPVSFRFSSGEANEREHRQDDDDNAYQIEDVVHGVCSFVRMR
jgi:hypothetical protein